MKKNFIISIFCLGIFLSSCTLGTLSEEQVQGTAHELAATMMSVALTEMPTSTSQPTFTPQPTSTPTFEPSPTASEAATEYPTMGPTFVATWTPYGLSDPGAFEEAKSDKADYNAPLLINNRTDEDVHFIMLNPVYQEYDFRGSMTLILPEGSYTFRAKIGKNTISGSFTITNGDKHVLDLYENKFHFSTP